MRSLELRATRADDGERLDRFIAARGGISRGLARRALEAGGVFLEGKRCKVASRQIWAGQAVTVHLEEGGRAAGAPAPLAPARLLFADADLCVVDKPAGVPAQPTLTTDRGALPELAAALLGAPVTLVHRLDRETSGVTAFARTAEAARALAEQFRTGVPEKTYLALCARAPSPPEGRIDAPLGPDPLRKGMRKVDPRGEPAATRYRTLAVGPGGEALVEARPETGRTHQIRVHLAHLGASLLGDPRYGGPRRVGELRVPRVMLHARRLELPHPAGGAPMAFEAPVPDDLAGLATALGLALPAR
ncbi:RluA family pseudouridine synthase [Anaeromyxobacter paludicola]|uniref:Pseudouridine synthase n=1 Tax=Anaeromyxobacter paludicola TaxID=2918171 RepID=A0ABM7XCF1_9BACT|nr:RluA family pseudouridine synthase [Anaeromyxobacter paludicola]BDG09547.1 putative RNA pseudouridine synthase [Anaeromyxobacter paludicola]